MLSIHRPSHRSRQKQRVCNFLFWPPLLGFVVVVFAVRGLAAQPFAYVANQLDNNVTVIDTKTNVVVATVPVGIAPRAVAITPNGTLAFVVNRTGNTVSVINTATNTVVAAMPVGSEPTDVAITPDGTRAYVTNYVHPFPWSIRLS